MHLLLHGSGFQTWEYSPVYALRSYYFLLPYALPAKLAALATEDKVVAFYAVRGAMAFVCSACEARFYRSVALSSFGPRVAAVMLAPSASLPAMVSGMPSSSVSMAGATSRDSTPMAAAISISASSPVLCSIC